MQTNNIFSNVWAIIYLGISIAMLCIFADALFGVISSLREGITILIGMVAIIGFLYSYDKFNKITNKLR